MQAKQSLTFEQHFRQRANRRVRRLFHRRLKVFLKNPHDPLLNDHALKHQWEGYRSWSLTDDSGPDDFRVVYKPFGKGRCLFVGFGTHDQLYRTWKKSGAYSL